MTRSDSINELATALAKAQAKIEAAPKDNTAKVKGKTRDGREIEYSYSYSTLADVWAACRAPLSENGLAVIQTVVTKGRTVIVTTMLAHSSGQWISEELGMDAADEKPQSVGSAITYARRYALGAIVGVVSEEDDDGNTANGNTHQTQRKPAVTGGQHGQAAPQAAPVASRDGDSDAFEGFKKAILGSKTDKEREGIYKEIGQAIKDGKISDGQRKLLIAVTNTVSSGLAA